MLVLHAHWEPPRTPSETGGMLFWSEITEAPAPAWQRGRVARNPKPKEHPFCGPAQALRFIGIQGEEQTAVLRLPTSRTGPLPSPGLAHNWELDRDTKPFLAPWIVKGAWLHPVDAFHVLINLPVLNEEAVEQVVPFSLSADSLYWKRAAALALETLALQKLVPILAPADAAGKTFHARWLPVLDSPNDGIRLAQLEAAMPPVCRSAFVDHREPPSPRLLLAAFLNTVCDALARR
ncbi:MAG: hypothetical protein ACM3PY_18990, partial [Omnitrophica WOR_2 bacterium]